MKLIEVKESCLGYALHYKRQKRKSYKWETKLKNKTFRKALNNNFELGNEIYKMRHGYEY